MKKPRHFSVNFLLVLIAAALMKPAHAQSDAILEEIVVTATKRGAVSLQDIAGSITAISSEALEKTWAEGFEDYIKMVPGLTSISSGPGQTQIVIRGVNAERLNHVTTQRRSLAGLYIDETPISMAGFNPDLGLVDIERIEVLRGPQGTLYGASSMAGTIRVITKKPDVEGTSGSISANVSNTADGDINHVLKGSLNAPLSDSIAMRFSAYNAKKGGFIDNVAPGFEDEDYNSQNTSGGRAQLGYYGDNLDVVGTFMYNDLEADGAPDEYVPNPEDARITSITDELQTHKVIDDSFHQEFMGFNLVVDYDFGPVKLTSATSVFDADIEKHLDDTFRVVAVTPIAAPYSDYQAWESFDTWIQEMRLSSDYDSKLQWVIGGYYEKNDREFVQTQPTPGTNAFFVSIGGPPPCPTLTSTCFGAVTDSVFDGVTSVKTDQIAGFGEFTYSLSNALRLTLGFRYFEYENEFHILGSGAANGGVSVDEDVVKEKDWVPKVELTYDISENHMIYATYSEGYRLGATNTFAPAVCGEELAALGSGPGAPLNSDSIQNTEVGAKTAWLDNRMTANVAVYRNEFDDIQSGVALECGFFQHLNAGTIENTGFEGEVTYQATDALALYLGFSYVDSEVTSAVPLLNVEGDEPPYIPKFSASASVVYGLAIGNGSGYIRSDLRHVGKSGNEFSSRPTRTILPSYTIVDLTLGYGTNGYNFTLFAKNLFDDKVITNIDPDRVQPNQFSRGLPRTLGIGFSKDF